MYTVFKNIRSCNVNTIHTGKISIQTNALRYIRLVKERVTNTQIARAKLLYWLYWLALVKINAVQKLALTAAVKCDVFQI